MKRLLLQVTLALTVVTTAYSQDPNWQYAAEMNATRRNHVAAVMADGRMLVAGGFDGSTNLTSAEIYDPYYNTWTTVAPMTNARSAAEAVALDDGRVLVMGGFNNSFVNQSSTEIYDPSNDSWADGPTMNDGRSYFAATKLADGKVLISGGYDGNGQVASVDVFDPTTDMIAATNDLLDNGWGSSARQYHSSELLNDGTVLVAAGNYNGFRLQDGMIWDPATGNWSYTANGLLSYRDQAASVVLADGRVLVSGGSNYNFDFNYEYGITYNEIYNPTDGTWTAAAEFDFNNFQGRYEHELFVLDGDRVLATGGTSQNDFGSGLFLAENQIYDVSGNTWTDSFMNADNAFPAVRFRSKAGALVEGKRIMATGGYNATTEIYDENSITLTAPTTLSGISIQNDDTSTEFTFSWDAGTHESASYQIVFYDANGDAQNSIIAVSSDNTGANATYTASAEDLYSMLEAEYGPLSAGDFFDLKWAVQGTIDGYKTISLNAFDITIEIFDPTIALSAPSAGTTIEVEDGGLDEIDFSWSNLNRDGFTYSYELEFDLSGGDFSSPLSVSAFSAAMSETTTGSLTTDALDQMLEDNSIGLLSTTDLDWRVVGSDGTTDYPSAPSAITVARGILFPSSPASGQEIQARANSTSEVDFSWRGVVTSEAVTYEWILDDASGDFSSPIATIAADNSGLDNTVTLTLGDLNDYAANAPVDPGSVLSTKWTVRASFGGNSITSSSSFNLDIRRGQADADNFDLLTPTDGTTVVTTGGSTSVNFTWGQIVVAGETITYKWLLDEAGGDFSDPLAEMPASNGGLNTAFIIDHDGLNQILSDNSLFSTGSFDGIWTIEATYGTSDPITISANQSNAITLNIILGTDIPEGMEMYPNPATNEVFVQALGDFTIRLLDLSGRVLMKGFGQDVLQLNTSAINPGLYIMEIENQGRTSALRLKID